MNIDSSDILIFNREGQSALSSIGERGFRSTLITNDLQLTSAYLSKDEVEYYTQILDLNIIENLCFLGYKSAKYSFLNNEKYPLQRPRYGHEEIGDATPNDRDALVTHTKRILNRLQNVNGCKRYYNIEVPFAKAIYYLTSNGVHVSKSKVYDFLNTSPHTHNKILNALSIYGVVDESFDALQNWCQNSTNKDFHNLYMRSFDDVYKNADIHPVFAIHKRLDKLKRTHSIIRDLSAGEDRLYPKYKVIGTSTCRCTTFSPNLMGLPKEMRSLVIPSSPERGIVEIDYSQMEVGVMAALSGDENLLFDFNSGDVYVKLAEFLEVNRDKAKQIFLSIINGASVRTLTRWLGGNDISVTEDILKAFFSRYSQLRKYLGDLEKRGQQYCYATSYDGLRRFVYRDSNYVPREARNWEKNWFKNFPIQSSASAIFKYSIIQLADQIDPKEYSILVPLYDSVVFEAPQDRIPFYTEITERCMIGAMKKAFPFLEPKVDVNDIDISCWNSPKTSLNLADFLGNPLKDLKLKERKRRLFD